MRKLNLLADCPMCNAHLKGIYFWAGLPNKALVRLDKFAYCEKCGLIFTIKIEPYPAKRARK